MMSKRINRPFLYTFIIYICGFLLFLEWLYPAVKLGDTGYFYVFISYAAFCFVVSFFQIKWYLSFIFKALGMLLVINHLFYETAFIQAKWLKPFINEITLNLSSLASQDWYDLSNMFRSVLFLLLIWLMSYLIYYWFLEVNQILLFIILTFVYITVLDTFTAYNAVLPIVRIFIFSLTSFAMVNLYKEIKRESISFKWFKNLPAWGLPIIIMVLLSTVIGFKAPHPAPQWSDPVPFIISTTTGNEQPDGNPPIQKSGYGEDDSQLGGSFIQDDTPVFQSVSKNEKYYRIESKDVYTGKGWERSSEPKEGYNDNSLESFKTFSEDVSTRSDFLEIRFYEDMQFDKLLYPYGISTVFSNKSVKLDADDETGIINAYLNDKNVELLNYRVLFNEPSFNINVLRQDVDSSPSLTKPEYRQLPENLPNRVVELAREITQKFDNKYDKAKAIEQYFGQVGFVYETSDVLVPEEDEDYVDQFLFETQAGYCDNYSTSMVVMLRSIGIPARWVKGFTGGEEVSEVSEKEDESRYIYEITNENAHSWVEVYFKEIGWVPFEPTQGFDNHVDFEESEDNLNLEQDSEQEELEEETGENEEDIKDDELDLDQPILDTSNDQPLKSIGSINKWYFIGSGLILILIIVSIYLYRKRYTIKTEYLCKKYQDQMDVNDYLILYDHMLKLLSHQGYAIKINQTLREYAIEIDEHYKTNEMHILTSVYEKVLYTNEIDNLKNEKLIDSYKNMTDHILRKKQNDKEN